MIRLLIGAVLISFSPVFVKVAGVPALASGFWRMAFGGLILLAWVCVRDGLKPPSGRLARILVLCAVFFTIDITCWHQAILSLGPGLGTLLANFQAVLLPLLALALLREPVRPVLALALPLALAGLWLIVGPQWADFGPGSRQGVALGLAAAFFYALYLLALKRAATGTDEDPLRIVAVLSLICAAFLGTAMAAAGDSFAIPSARSWIALVGYGVVGQVLGWVFITRGARTTPTALVGLLLLAQPVCSYLWDVLFFARRPGLLEMAGVGLALAGIYLGTRARA